MDRPPPRSCFITIDFFVVVGWFSVCFFFLSNSHRLAFASLEQSMATVQPRQLAAVVALKRNGLADKDLLFLSNT